MIDLDPGEAVRNYYRIQGAQSQVRFDLDIIGNYCAQNHTGQVCHCIQIVEAIQTAVILEYQKAQ